MTGIICLWSGAIVDIPNGWALCDGNNGTPDLRNRFIVGAGDTYAVAAAGGNLNHSHFVNMPEEFVQITGDTGDETIYLDYGTDIDYAYDDPYYAENGQGHYHTVGLEGEGHDHDCNTDSEDSRPPYYALAYIMKL